MTDELDDLKKLAGLDHFVQGGKKVDWKEWTGSNPSVTGTEKAKIQREKNIQPGTEEWFRLYFSRPKLTGEAPFGDKPLKSPNELKKSEDPPELKNWIKQIRSVWDK